MELIINSHHFTVISVKVLTMVITRIMTRQSREQRHDDRMSCAPNSFHDILDYLTVSDVTIN